MTIIELVSPCKEMKSAAIVYRQEHFDHGEMIINGSSLFDKIDSYDEWLLHIARNSNEETVPPDWVVSSVFFGVRKSDNKIIGVIDCRHYLNDFLREYGGHIGYAVRPSERGKGYATQMLNLALEHYKRLKVSKVMLGCYKENLPSVRTIEKNGGILEKEMSYIDGKPMFVYWIELNW
ncbi:MAG: GNAT family N-acetyltransferase [Coriobacteriales bacterium]|jgi:predicted acetyltransferase|nr:GNAT family N-acetyltransferase [Coriobacteriales bacterium]